MNKITFCEEQQPSALAVADLASILATRGWYRLEERETVKTPAPLKIGTQITFQRKVARAGYWIEPKDMPEQDVETAAMAWLVKQTGLNEDQINTVVMALGNCSIPHASGHLPVNDWPIKQICRQLAHTVRGHWYWEARRRYTNGDPNLRTLWYQDLAMEWELPITGKVVRQIGKYCMASGNYSYWDDSWEPAGIDVRVYQQLYRCGDNPQTQILVHPADVLSWRSVEGQA